MIASIDEDALNKVAIHLLTGNEYETAGMTLSNPDRPNVAKLKKGESITIHCDRMMRISGSPQGSDCSIVALGNATPADEAPPRGSAGDSPATTTSEQPSAPAN